MKKAEEYLQQFKILRSNYKEREPFPFNLTRDAHIGSYCDILKAIKQAQLDAIEETVKRCAEKAKTKAEYRMNVKGSKFKTWKKNDEINIFDTVLRYSVNKQSILNVAQQLKKEIE